MLPKKVRDILPEVVDDLGLPSDMVEAVHKFFWEAAQKALGEAPKLIVHVANLGDFVVKHWKLEGELRQLQQMKDIVLRRPKPNKHVIDKLDKQVELITRLIEQRKVENQRRSFIRDFKERRNEDVKANAAANLEE